MSKGDELSAREMDVARAIADGLTSKEIGQRLGLNEHTIKNYTYRAMDKLGVHNRVAVAKWVWERDLANKQTAEMDR